MSEHTPGPWTLGRSTDRCPTILDTTGEIAAVWKSDHAMANARLIAAAPDMLEALQWVLPLLQSRDWDIDGLERLHQVEDTIARATGGKP